MFEKLLAQFWHLLTDLRFIGDWLQVFAIIGGVIGLVKGLDWLGARWRRR